MTVDTLRQKQEVATKYWSKALNSGPVIFHGPGTASGCLAPWPCRSRLPPTPHSTASRGA